MVYEMPNAGWGRGPVAGATASLDAPYPNDGTRIVRRGGIVKCRAASASYRRRTPAEARARKECDPTSHATNIPPEANIPALRVQAARCPTPAVRPNSYPSGCWREEMA